MTCETSGLNPNKQFHNDDSANRCPVCAKAYKWSQDLKTHQTKTGHKHEKTYKITDTAFVDTVTAKRKTIQNEMSKVCWGNKQLANS